MTSAFATNSTIVNSRLGSQTTKAKQWALVTTAQVEAIKATTPNARINSALVPATWNGVATLVKAPLL